MKILLYTHDWLPLIGGIQTVYLDLATGLNGWAKKHPDEEVEAVLVTQTPADGMDDSRLPFRVVRQPGLGGLIDLLLWADVVHVAGVALQPLLLAVLLRKRFVVEHHGFQVACPNGQLFFEPTQMPCPGHFMAGRYRKCLECNAKAVGGVRSVARISLAKVRRWLARRAEVNITPTAWLAEMLEIPRAKTIHHGVAPETAKRRATGPNQCSLVPEPFDRQPSLQVAYQGRLATSKGVGVLLRAAEKLQREGYEFHLKIIGGGTEREALEKQAASLGSRVEFLGLVPDHELSGALSEAAMVVVPSLGGEVFGMVAAENMERGKVVIVSDLGSLREVVGEAGLVFPAGDAGALCARLREALDNPQLRAALGAAARERAEKLFNCADMIGNHLDVYRELLAGGRVSGDR